MSSQKEAEGTPLLTGMGLCGGLVSGGAGLWLARGDWLSLAIVGVACAVWALFYLALRRFDSGLSRHPPADLGARELQMHAWLPSGQAVLISFGLFGTFLGLSMGLMESIPCIDADTPGHAECVAGVLSAAVAGGLSPESAQAEAENLAMQQGMSYLLSGARLAFSKSVAGIGLGLSYLLLFRLVARRRSDHIARIRHEHPRVDPVVTQLQKILEAQPEPGAMKDAAISLRDGANRLGRVAADLDGVASTLASFQADVIGRQVSEGVKAAVKSELSPTMKEISRQLTILHEMKRQTDEAVSAQLEKLVTDLEQRALAPITAQVTAANAITRQVAEKVEALSATVAHSTSAVQATSKQMGQLTGQLEQFQRDTLQKLHHFAEGLGHTLATFTRDSSQSFEAMGTNIHRSVETACLGMEAQREAFEASASTARKAFTAQTATIQAAGVTVAAEIEHAGTAASAALNAVQSEFAAALMAQRTSLQSVLDKLEGAFSKDLAHREAFEETSSRAVARVQAFLEQAASMQAMLVQTAPTVLGEVNASVQLLGTATASQREAMLRLEGALVSHFERLNDNHHNFLKAEDAHLADVLGGLHTLVETIAEASREVAQSRHVVASG